MNTTNNKDMDNINNKDKIKDAKSKSKSKEKEIVGLLEEKGIKLRDNKLKKLLEMNVDLKQLDYASDILNLLWEAKEDIIRKSIKRELILDLIEMLEFGEVQR